MPDDLSRQPVCMIAEKPHDYIHQRQVRPFVISNFITLLVITYVPAISTALLRF